MLPFYVSVLPETPCSSMQVSAFLPDFLLIEVTAFKLREAYHLVSINFLGPLYPQGLIP